MLVEICIGLIISYVCYSKMNGGADGGNTDIYGIVNVYKDGVQIDSIKFITYSQYDEYVTDIATYGHKGSQYVFKDAETGSELAVINIGP